MNVSREPGWSSPLLSLDVLVRAVPDAQRVTQETVPVRTLDEILEADLAANPRFAVKVDVQGFEHAVFAGAACLERVEFLEVELSLTPLYAGQSLWRQLPDRIEEFGLEPAWIESCWFVDPNSGRGPQFNALFVRP